MRTVSYCTALYHKQSYCQRERVDCFNLAAREAAKDDLKVHVQLYINNSPRKFITEMLRLYHKNADFEWHMEDLGRINYETEYDRDEFGVRWLMEDDTGRLVDTKPDDRLIFGVKHFDIYRLLAEVFNKGIDYSTTNGHDFYGILSGDQLLPPEHPSRLVKFLDEHPQCGIASALAFYDWSKREVVKDGNVKTFMVPLIMFRPHEGESDDECEKRRQWVYAHLLPHAENDWTGMEYCEVDALGTGGAIILRKVFTQLRFKDKKFEGEGEDIQYCLDVRSKLGLKVFVLPTVIIKNRYPDGSSY